MNDLVPANPDAALSGLTDGDLRALVVDTLAKAKVLLAEAKVMDLPFVVEDKARAETLRCYVAQKDIGKDAELTATEIVRRAERRIAELVRESQDAGHLQRPGQRNTAGGGISPPPPHVAAGVGHSGDLTRYYAMTDGVPPERFEDAITEAREEGNLSRAHVTRKLKKDKPVTREPSVSAAASAARRQRARSNRIVRETVHALEGFVRVVGDVEVADLDPDHIEDWTASLRESLRELTKFTKELAKQ